MGVFRFVFRFTTCVVLPSMLLLSLATLQQDSDVSVVLFKEPTWAKVGSSTGGVWSSTQLGGTDETAGHYLDANETRFTLNAPLPLAFATTLAQRSLAATDHRQRILIPVNRLRGPSTVLDVARNVIAQACDGFIANFAHSAIGELGSAIVVIPLFRAASALDAALAYVTADSRVATTTLDWCGQQWVTVGRALRQILLLDTDFLQRKVVVVRAVHDTSSVHLSLHDVAQRQVDLTFAKCGTRWMSHRDVEVSSSSSSKIDAPLSCVPSSGRILFDHIISTLSSAMAWIVNGRVVLFAKQAASTIAHRLVHIAAGYCLRPSVGNKASQEAATALGGAYRWLFGTVCHAVFAPQPIPPVGSSGESTQTNTARRATSSPALNEWIAPFCEGEAVLDDGVLQLGGWQSLCVSLPNTFVHDTVHPRSEDGIQNGERLQLSVIVRSERDWMTIVLAYVALFMLRRRQAIAHNRIFQMLLTGAFGCVVCLSAMVYFFISSFQSTRLGKIGIIAVIAAGGTSAARGAFGNIISSAVGELQQNPLWQVAAAAITVVSAVVARLFFSRYLSTVVGMTLPVGIVGLWSLAWWRNPTLAIFTWIWFFAAKFTMANVRRWLLTDTRFGIPSDHLPRVARVAKEYQQPIAEGISGRNAADKMRIYEQLGRDSTKVELEKLAEYIRTHPAACASRLREPNSVMHWAGVGYGSDTAGDDSGAEDEDE